MAQLKKQKSFIYKKEGYGTTGYEITFTVADITDLKLLFNAAKKKIDESKDLHIDELPIMNFIERLLNVMSLDDGQGLFDQLYKDDEEKEYEKKELMREIGKIDLD